MTAARDAPLVSIPVCTFNGARFLEAQLDSLLLQTHANLEILIFDDGSTDATPVLLANYEQRDSRIRVFINEKNRGFASNFAQALKACTGEFIAPCDQDDVWLPDKVASLLSGIHDHSLIFCDSLLVDEQGQSLGKRISDVISMRSVVDPLMLAFLNCVSGHACLFRRELVQLALPIPDEYFYDHWIALVAAAEKGVGYWNEVLVHYRQHSTNVSDITGSRWHAERRKSGYRLRQWRRLGKQLQALSRLPGKQQALVRELAELWHKRESAWVCPRLCYLLWKLDARLYALDRKTYWARLARAKRQFFGIPVKRLFRPHPYQLTEE